MVIGSIPCFSRMEKHGFLSLEWGPETIISIYKLIV
jgi:hypothetical protein